MNIWALIFRLHEPACCVSTFLAILFNGLLFYFISYKTKHDFGIYKRILKFLCLFNIFYSIVQTTTMPLLYAIDFYLISIPGGYFMGFFSKNHQVLWSCFNASCFGVSHAVLAVHFAYRYIQICQYHRGYLLTGYYQLIWGSYMLLCFGIWMVATFTCLSPTVDKDLLVFPDVLKAYGFSMENRGYMGPQYWVHRGNKLELQFKDCFGMFSVCSMTGTAIIMMCFCGYKTYNGMSNVVASAKTRRLQRQLFYSLVTLTAIPLAFIYGPLVLCFLGPIVGLGMGRFGIVYHWLLTIPPFFEPIVLIYFIGDYRRAALGILGRLDCCSLFPQIWRGELFTSSAYKTSTANNSTQQTRPSSEVNRSENDRNNL